MEDDSTIDTDMDGFNGIFPQGYMAWVFGSCSESIAAYNWLKSSAEGDGSLVCYAGDPEYSLSVNIYAMSASVNGKPVPRTSLDWLIGNTYDHDDGGVIDTADPSSDKYSNVQGFTIIALLGCPNML